MRKAYLFDLSRTILFPKDKSYQGELNARHKELSLDKDYNFSDHFELDEELLNYLNSIKDRCESYIFTSGSIQNAPEIKSRLEQVFKKIFSAEEIGFKKTDPKAYEYILEQIGRRPYEVLFIDDSRANIEAAQQAGLGTWLYSDYKDLEERIKKSLNAE